MEQVSREMLHRLAVERSGELVQLVSDLIRIPKSDINNTFQG